MRVWDVGRRRCLASVRGHTNAVTALSGGFGKNSSFPATVLSASTDRTLRLWRLESQLRSPDLSSRCLHVLTGHSRGIAALRTLRGSSSEAGYKALSGDNGGDVSVWNLTTRSCIEKLAIAQSPIVGVWGDLGTGRCLAAASNGTLWQWGLSSSAHSKHVLDLGSELAAIDVSEDLQLAVASFENRTLSVLDLRRPNADALVAYASIATALAVDWGRRLLLAGTEAGPVLVLDLRRSPGGYPFRYRLQGHRSRVTALCLTGAALA